MTVLELTHLDHRLAELVHVGGEVCSQLWSGLGQDLVEDPDHILVRVILIIEQDAALVAVLKRELEVWEQLLLLEARHQVLLGLGVRHDVDAVSDDIVQHVSGAGPQV